MGETCQVLNLVINGIPSIRLRGVLLVDERLYVLNLVINGIPSILKKNVKSMRLLEF